jgi:hypothetical protein
MQYTTKTGSLNELRGKIQGEWVEKIIMYEEMGTSKQKTVLARLKARKAWTDAVSISSL